MQTLSVSLSSFPSKPASFGHPSEARYNQFAGWVGSSYVNVCPEGDGDSRGGDDDDGGSGGDDGGSSGGDNGSDGVSR